MCLDKQPIFSAQIRGFVGMYASYWSAAQLGKFFSNCGRSFLGGVIVIIFSLGIAAQNAAAHELQPSIIDIAPKDGAISISIETNLEALIAGIGADHDDTDDAPEKQVYNGLRALDPTRLKNEFTRLEKEFSTELVLRMGGEKVALTFVEAQVPDNTDIRFARDSLLIYSATATGDPKSSTWQSPAAFAETIIRVRDSGGGIAYTEFLNGQNESKPFTLEGVVEAQSGFSIFLNYIAVGFEHIVPLGLDHIVFVIGLFLFSPKLRPLLLQVTAFTLAHTITLALGALNIVSITPWIVESIIALSIVYVGVENILFRDFQRHRIVLVFAFGLLQGLGFAGVLGEFGLPENAFIPALIGFNIGVEFGQLAVIAVCLALTFLIRSQSWYRQVVTIPVSLVIAAIGLYWVLERTGILPESLGGLI